MWSVGRERKKKREKERLQTKKRRGGQVIIVKTRGGRGGRGGQAMEWVPECICGCIRVNGEWANENGE